MGCITNCAYIVSVVFLIHTAIRNECNVGIYDLCPVLPPTRGVKLWNYTDAPESCILNDSPHILLGVGVGVGWSVSTL